MNTKPRTYFPFRILLIVALAFPLGGCDTSVYGFQPPTELTTWYRDADGDGYSNGTMLLSAVRPSGYSAPGALTALLGDCDDDDASVHPGGTDLDGDGIDQDCNGFEISGPAEVVFDWTTDRCEDVDIPDFPARAFRDHTGQVQLISSNHKARRFLGPDLDNVSHDCLPVMESHLDPDPAMFNDIEWIGATYTEDGSTIYAIVHNEYEAWTHAGQCSAGSSFMDCWYNGLTLAVSTDAGLSYTHPVAPPLHLIAASSLQYEKDVGPHGIFHPSGIVKGTDGYYYAMVHRVRRPDPSTFEQWTCVVRTPDLSDPDAWRFWNGSAFAGVFVNPYMDPVGNPQDHDCPGVDSDDIADMTGSLVWSEYLERYILTGPSVDGSEHGFFISYSDDLIEWTPRELILQRHLGWTSPGPGEPYFLYPSLLDPDSAARNFDTIGKTAYIYHMRNNRAQGDLDRDLLRTPIEFFRY